MSIEHFDYNNGFVCNIKKYLDDIDTLPIKKTYLSQLANVFKDKNAYYSRLEKENPLVYEYIGFPTPESGEHITTGVSIIHPGNIGNEYFMTRGHVHERLDFAEVYYVLSGDGYMLMQKTNGTSVSKKLSANDLLYVPGNCAHRTVNTGVTDLIMLFALRADAGHDYQIVEEKGFSDCIFKTPEGARLVDGIK